MSAKGRPERELLPPGGKARSAKGAPTSERPHWLDQPRNVKRLWRGFLVMLALTVAAELAVVLHPAFAVEALFGFHAAYGFLACAAMIVGAKVLGIVLKRPDDYYEADDE